MRHSHHADPLPSWSVKAFISSSVSIGESAATGVDTSHTSFTSLAASTVPLQHQASQFKGIKEGDVPKIVSKNFETTFAKYLAYLDSMDLRVHLELHDGCGLWDAKCTEAAAASVDSNFKDASLVAYYQRVLYITLGHGTRDKSMEETRKAGRLKFESTKDHTTTNAYFVQLLAETHLPAFGQQLASAKDDIYQVLKKAWTDTYMYKMWWVAYDTALAEYNKIPGAEPLANYELMETFQTTINGDAIARSKALEWSQTRPANPPIVDLLKELDTYTSQPMVRAALRSQYASTQPAPKPPRHLAHLGQQQKVKSGYICRTHGFNQSHLTAKCQNPCALHKAATAKGTVTKDHNAAGAAAAKSKTKPEHGKSAFYQLNKTYTRGSSESPAAAGPVKEFKCFNCYEIGHSAKQCPKPRKLTGLAAQVSALTTEVTALAARVQGAPSQGASTSSSSTPTLHVPTAPHAGATALSAVSGAPAAHPGSFITDAHAASLVRALKASQEQRSPPPLFFGGSSAYVAFVNYKVQTAGPEPEPIMHPAPQPMLLTNPYNYKAKYSSKNKGKTRHKASDWKYPGPNAPAPLPPKTTAARRDAATPHIAQALAGADHLQ